VFDFKSLTEGFKFASQVIATEGDSPKVIYIHLEAMYGIRALKKDSIFESFFNEIIDFTVVAGGGFEPPTFGL